MTSVVFWVRFFFPEQQDTLLKLKWHERVFVSVRITVHSLGQQREPCIKLMGYNCVPI